MLTTPKTSLPCAITIGIQYVKEPANVNQFDIAAKKDATQHVRLVFQWTSGVLAKEKSFVQEMQDDMAYE